MLARQALEVRPDILRSGHRRGHPLILFMSTLLARVYQEHSDRKTQRKEFGSSIDQKTKGPSLISVATARFTWGRCVPIKDHGRT